MSRKTIYLIMVLPLVIIMAACSSLKLPGAQPAAAAAASQPTREGGFANFANQPVENKLAIGTLKLEGTSYAVTASEAKTLLPLWQAVKSLSASSTTSPEEIQALYKQIEETMTPDQVTAIKNLKLQQADFTSLMQQYGIQAPQGGGGLSNLTPSERATRVAQFQAQRGNNGGNGGGGNFGGAGGAGGFGGGGGGFGGANGGANSGTGQPNAQRTPQPGRRNLGGINYLFVDPVIKLLQQKAGA